MIKKSDIYNFFDNECNARKEEMNELYSMELEERIKKRKAIENVTFDSDYKESKMGYLFDYRNNEDDIDAPYRPNASVILKNALEKLDCKIDVTHNEHLLVTSQNLVFEFILEEQWLKIYLPFKSLPLDAPYITPIYKLINETNMAMPCI